MKKKNFLFILSTILVVITLSLTGCRKHHYESFCFEQNGLINQEGKCVLPEQPPVIETVEIPVIVTVEVPVEKIVEVVVTPTPMPVSSEVLSEKTEIDFGDIVGAFHLTPNEIYNRWELNWDERYRTSPGISCTEVMAKGATGSFLMPSDGYINSVVGDITVNGVRWANGNPVTGPDGQQFIAKGSTIDFRFYGTASDCLAIWIPYN